MNVGPRTATGAVLAAVLVAGLFISHDYHVDVSQVAKVIAAVRAMGPLGWLSFASMQAVIAALGIVPASPLGIGAGLATGVWFGFLLSATGTLLGGLMAFQLSRSLLRPWISRFLVKRMGAARLDDAIARDGWKFVCLMRISPIMPFAVTSYALGLNSDPTARIPTGHLGVIAGAAWICDARGAGERGFGGNARERDTAALGAVGRWCRGDRDHDTSDRTDGGCGRRAAWPRSRVTESAQCAASDGHSGLIEQVHLEALVGPRWSETCDAPG